MNSKAPAWLLLITNLPGRNPTLRMRIWRALKTAGAGLLKDGVYVLPNSAASRRVFEEQGGEIKAGGGFVQIVSFYVKRFFEDCLSAHCCPWRRPSGRARPHPLRGRA